MKPGWRTSEFWLSTSAQIIGMLLASGVVPSDGQMIKILGLASAVLSTLGYTVARAMTKVAHIDAISAMGSTLPDPQ